jgi:hypothetical protein
MTSRQTTFDRLTVYVTRSVSVVLVGLLLTLVLLLAIASHQLAAAQQRLAPLVAQTLSQTLGREVRIGAVQFDGWDTVIIKEAAIAKGTTFANGTALHAPEATAHINLLALILQQGKHPLDTVRQLTLTRPVLAVERSAAGRWDFQDIVDRINNSRTLGKLKTQLVVAEGKINYQDERGFKANPETIRKALVGITGRLTPTGAVNYQFELSAVDAPSRVGRIQLSGDYAGHAGATNVNVSASRVAVKEIAQYLPQHLPITFEDGTAAFRLSALFQNLPNPNVAHNLPTTKLTAEVDLAGVGLRLNEMSAPVVATSGKLRLVHDPNRYPHGSRLELIKVRAHAGAVPMDISGTIGDLNLFDLPHLNPYFQVTVRTAVGNGAQIAALFPHTQWVQDLHRPRGWPPDRFDHRREHPQCCLSDCRFDGDGHCDAVHTAPLRRRAGRYADHQHRRRDATRALG